MFNIEGISDEAIANRIPGVMGTQHPDNFSRVPFGSSPRVTRELEEEEVLYNVRDLAIREMMIDYEKKRGNVQRSFIARSDPALTAGMLAAQIAAVTALDQGRRYEAKTGIRIPPILGVGSSPFRGGLTPAREIIDRVLHDYPGVATVTVQSAFRYDNPADTVVEACRRLEEKTRAGWLGRGEIGSALTEDDIKSLGELLDSLQQYYEAS